MALGCNCDVLLRPKTLCFTQQVAIPLDPTMELKDTVSAAQRHDIYTYGGATVVVVVSASSP